MMSIQSNRSKYSDGSHDNDYVCDDDQNKTKNKNLEHFPVDIVECVCARASPYGYG